MKKLLSMLMLTALLGCQADQGWANPNQYRKNPAPPAPDCYTNPELTSCKDVKQDMSADDYADMVADVLAEGSNNDKHPGTHMFPAYQSGGNVSSTCGSGANSYACWWLNNGYNNWKVYWNTTNQVGQVPRTWTLKSASFQFCWVTLPNYDWYSFPTSQLDVQLCVPGQCVHVENLDLTASWVGSTNCRTATVSNVLNLQIPPGQFSHVEIWATPKSGLPNPLDYANTYVVNTVWTD